jgi:hypothetical protein
VKQRVSLANKIKCKAKVIKPWGEEGIPLAKKKCILDSFIPIVATVAVDVAVAVCVP